MADSEITESMIMALRLGVTVTVTGVTARA